MEVTEKKFQERIFKDGMELWKKQKEFERQKKMHEQKEMRDLLDKYWPWERGDDAKPRGLRNLRLEELFPDKDYRNAKRFVGTMDLGRGGGGAPIVSGGRKVTRTIEDPLLRFQFGSKDLRRCVDNRLRYKTNKNAQIEYKKELDQLVEVKKKREQQEKTEDVQFHKQQFLKPPPWGKQGPGGKQWRKPNAIGINFLKSLGWSTENTLKQLELVTRNKANDVKRYNNFKNMTLIPPNKIIRGDPIAYPRKKPRKLSPLSDNRDEGVELVALLAKDRKYPPKIPLCSSDVTSERKLGKLTIWDRQGSAYLRELAHQMIQKQQQLMEMKAKENETTLRHFSTCDGFWGRPGNGAPMAEFKKQSLDQLLYPKITPISVH